MVAISCRERAFFLSGAPSGMHQGDILPGIRSPPSSARSAPRGCFIQRARLRLSEMSLENASSRNVALRLFGNTLQRCFVRGPSSAQANERWLLRCSAHVGLPLRCRGALGDAALRSFGHRMSPLMRMAAERAEHEQVQVRARMPLPPRRCRIWRAARSSRAAWR